MDRLTSMNAFVKAAELGSFSAAAEVLQISSQLVGKHVHQLEQRLGMRLLNRTTRRQSLTDFGRSFYERAKIILAEVEHAENLAAEAQALPSGRLRGPPFARSRRRIARTRATSSRTLNGLVT